MTSKTRSLLCATVLFLAAAPAAAQPGNGGSKTKTVRSSKATSKTTKKPQVLFLTKSAGFEHAVIKQKDGQPSHAEKIMKDLGEKWGFDVTHTKDASLLGPEGLAHYDVFVLFTTGDLTVPGTDKHPALPSKDAFLDTIRKGKGLVGIHSATDTFHTDSDRWTDDGDSADPFIKAIGGEFISHGQQQVGKLYFPDKKFPGFAEAKDGFEIKDEWYSLKNINKDMHVLAWLATWHLQNTGGDSSYRRAPYPIAWSRKEGKGRVFYTAMGHREDVWEHPFFQSTLIGGIKWAAGKASGSVKPNILQVTPGYAELPPQDPKPARPPTAAARPVSPAAPSPPKAAAAPKAP